ncbi:hypothetical protein ABK040_005793 [Willaertia magna]
MSKKALVCIANGSEEMEAVNVIDTLRRAKIEVTVAKVSQDDNERKTLGIVASRGVKLEADTHLEQICDQDFDAIVLPGGLGGAKVFAENQTLLDRLKKQKLSGKTTAAICASPAIVFSKNGLLEGITKATCYPSLKEQMPNHINWENHHVVVDHNIVTSQGPATAIPFALKLIEILEGKEKSQEVAKGLLHVD